MSAHLYACHTEPAAQLFEGLQRPSHDQQLSLTNDRHTIVWSAPSYSLADTLSPHSHTVLKSFTATQPVTAVVRTQFPSNDGDSNGGGGSDDWCIAALHSDVLTVYHDSGHTHHISLPCKVRAIHPLAFGLLFERLVDRGESMGEHPVYFTLMAVMEEIKPVSIYHTNTGMTFHCDIYERVLMTDSDRGLVVCYSEEVNEHRLYVVRQSQSQANHRQAHTHADSDSISSEFLFEPCWRYRGRNEPAAKVLFATDHCDMPLMCLMFQRAQELTGFSITDTNDVKQAFAIPALDAVAVNRQDIVLLTQQHRLSLYSGSQCLTDISLSPPSLSLPLTSSIVTAVSDAIRDRFTVHCSDGRTYRAFMADECVSVTVRHAFLAMRSSLTDSELLLNLRRDWLCSKHAHPSLENENESDSEWKLFCALLLDLLSPSSHSRDTKRQKLVNHYHTDSHSLQRHACDLLLALHLLYEDCKLDVRRHSALPSLACLCFDIAGRLGRSDWCQYYQRDCISLTMSVDDSATISDSVTGASTLLGDEPPSIQQWVSLSLKTPSHKSLPRYPLPRRSLADPNSPCELSRRVCECYDLIHSQSGDSGYYHSASATASIAELVVSKPHQTPLAMSAMRATAEAFTIFSPSLACQKRLPLSQPLLASQSTETAPAFQQQLLELISRSFTLTTLAYLPFGVALPLYEVLHVARHSPEGAHRLDANTLALIGRMDLAAMAQHRHHRRSTHTHTDRAATEGNSDIDDLDGTMLLVASASMRFGSDLRLKEVRHLLSSSRLFSLSLTAEKLKEIEASQGASDLQHEQQSRMLLLMQRVLSLSVGRGALTFGTSDSSRFASMPLPPITVTARVHPSHATVELDLSSLPTDYLDWPNFHNGVAAGLRIRKGRNSIRRTWIIYNRPAVLTHQHAGFLFALGIQGHLTCLAATDYYWYLQHHHDATTVGLLLGLSAANRGSQDTLTSKMLCLHVPAFLPSTLDIGLSFMVRSAALVGLGLLYEGSAHRLMTEVLLGELSKRGTEKGNEREGYSLAAGIGLGLVMLGRAGDAIGVTDLKLEERLLSLIHGGLSDGKQRRVAGQLTGSIKSPHAVRAGQGHIDEGPFINIDLTAPGALIALALMYARSNAAHIADHLRPPQSHVELEQCRADQLLLRAVARNVILWQGIEAEKEFIERQIPAFISAQVMSMNDYVRWKDVTTTAARKPSSSQTAESADDFAMHSDDDSADSADMDEVDFAVHSVILDSDDDDDTANPMPSTRRARRANQLPSKAKKPAMSSGSGVDSDYESLRQAYCGIIAGACLSLALKYAGTANIEAAHILSYYLRCFRAIRRKSSPSTASPRSLHLLDKHLTDTCLMTVALGLSVVMAGTGDVECFTLIRSLRTRMDCRQSLAHQQSLHLSLGLLFLGGGQYTLDMSLQSLASLLISLCPVYSSLANANDQRFYLQALRHLYALAVVDRSIVAIDIDTGTQCYCHIEVQHTNDSGESAVVGLSTPCLLPPNVSRVTINDSLYWHYTVPSEMTEAGDGSRILFVQRRKGQLLRDINAEQFHRTLTTASSHDTNSDYERISLSTIGATSADSYDWRHVRQLLVLSESLTIGGELFSQLARQWLFECIQHEKLELFAYCLTIDLLTQPATDRALLTNEIIRSFDILFTFYSSARDSLCQRLAPSAVGTTARPIFSLQFVEEIHRRLKQFVHVSEGDRDRAEWLALLSDGSTNYSPLSQSLAQYLAFYSLPSARALHRGLSEARRLLASMTEVASVERASMLLPCLAAVLPQLSIEALQQLCVHQQRSGP